MNVLIWLLTVIHVLVAVFLIVLVLMQKSKDQGVGAAFGGGVTDTVFGAGTTTALVRMTIWCGCILLITTLWLAILHSHRRGAGSSLIEKALQSAPSAPASSPLTIPGTSPATPTAPATPAGATTAPVAPATPEATAPQTPAGTESTTPEPPTSTPSPTTNPTEQKP